MGSGPAAAGAALALAEDPTQDILVVDIGTRLEADAAGVVDELGTSQPENWSTDQIEMISRQPVATSRRALPEKRVYGSDFPFRDEGQLRGLSSAAGANRSVVSSAYGGFSNVWGSQLMPYSEATFRDWPFSLTDLAPHYRKILDHVPLTGAVDDLAEIFPLFREPRPLPSLAPRTRQVIGDYDRYRAKLRRHGVIVGKARLAVQSEQCVRCGLCMTGCPYRLIYSSTQTFDELIDKGRVKYLPGLLVSRVEESETGVRVFARETATLRMQEFDADRVLLAAGALGSTRIAVNSMGWFGESIELAESIQFAVPMISRRRTPDPRAVTEMTLNQFNMVIALDDINRDLAQIHFYPYNPAMDEALPGFLTHGPASMLGDEAMRHLTVGLGYLPSWESPKLVVRASPAAGDGDLPEVHLSGTRDNFRRNGMLRQVVRRLVKAAPFLDLWPVVPMISCSAPGKSYHWGGSFPHSRSAQRGRYASDPLGRVGGWQRLHLVDASVLPSVAATTFTFTIMANAHRIGSELRGL
ncbi:GMC oxidoreductase [Frankia sp. QA3]|uniref:GMC oxidoreductase n=1 Tax=Frankia sp. QA3 TaxID=710111 RepID=UPI0002D99162|nr:GMC oxidoreductase [Frankia sp. QA3]